MGDLNARTCLAGVSDINEDTYWLLNNNLKKFDPGDLVINNCLNKDRIINKFGRLLTDTYVRHNK